MANWKVGDEFKLHGIEDERIRIIQKFLEDDRVLYKFSSLITTGHWLEATLPKSEICSIYKEKNIQKIKDFLNE